MSNGIYFIEPNTNIISDFENYFIINDNFEFSGSSASFANAYNEINSNSNIKFIVINEKALDSDCVTMLSELSSNSAVKIVTLENNNEALKTKISSMGAFIIMKPYSYSDLEKIFSNSCQQQSFNTVQNSSTQSNSTTQDNPFAKQQIQNQQQRPDIQERLRNIRRKPTDNKNKIIKQQVIAIHNQKGGVGKTTLSKELATALRCMKIQANGEEYTPKVCLCDFDLDSSDIVSMLNLPSSPNISRWCNDLDYEAKRIGEPVESIRFAEKDIKDNYLIKDTMGSGMYVLAAPENKAESTQIHMEQIEAIIENLKLCDFDIILLDTGPNIFDYTIMSLIKADIILAVSTCEVASARRLDGVINDILSLMPECNSDKIKLVINKYNPEVNISPKELIDVLNLELYGVIPDYPEISNLNNHGYSVFLNKTKGKDGCAPYMSSIVELAKKVSGIDKLQARNQQQYNPQYNNQQYQPQQIAQSQQIPQQQQVPQQFAPQYQQPYQEKPKKKGFFKRFFGEN